MVSLVVLNYNGREHLKACLGSVVALDYPPERLEVLLCDNGSSDGSIEYVRENYPTVRIVALDKNYGFAEGNNRAAAQARHEWIGFLNNDMRIEPSWLQSLVGPLAEQPRIAAISSRIMNWNGTAIDFIGSGLNFQGFGFQLDFGLKRSGRDVAKRVLSPCGGAMLVRRELFIEIGGFDPDYFGFYEDADLGWRLNLLGHDVWYTPDATAYHRHHGTYKRFAEYRLRVLYERNAMATMYKCLDPDNLNRALPAAMLLLNEKVVLLSDIDRGLFQISRPTPAAAAAAPTGQVSIVRKATTVYRERGLRPLLGSGIGYARASGRRVLRRGRRRLLRNTVPMSMSALGHYVGLSEFAHSMEDLQRKRQWLQERRVRSDAELLPLFHFALQPTYSEPDYVRFHYWLCRVLGIDERFRAGQDTPTPA